MAKGTYYMGRVIKLGVLTQESFMDAMLDSPVIEHGKFAWALTDMIDQREADPPFMYGHLSKFAVQGHVKIVDTEEKAQVDALAENLVIASSPFVYLPEYSGIAYLHVWNQIQEDVFPRRFCSIINAAFDDFFVVCSIEPVSDYDTFVAKLRELDEFTEISAKVNPPNPLFGRLWASLNEYIDKRNATELSLTETANGSEGLRTDISNLMENLSKNHEFVPDTDPDITDAALLMAADGYGSGKVVGRQNGTPITIRTSETKKSFRSDRDPDPNMLAQIATGQFRRVSQERDMDH